MQMASWKDLTMAEKGYNLFSYDSERIEIGAKIYSPMVAATGYGAYIIDLNTSSKVFTRKIVISVKSAGKKATLSAVDKDSSNYYKIN